MSIKCNVKLRPLFRKAGPFEGSRKLPIHWVPKGNYCRAPFRRLEWEPFASIRMGSFCRAEPVLEIPSPEALPTSLMWPHDGRWIGVWMTGVFFAPQAFSPSTA